MTGARDWVVTVPARRYREERLYRRDRLVLPDLAGLVRPDGSRPVPGDRVVLVAALRPALIFGWGTIAARSPALPPGPRPGPRPGPEPAPFEVVYERRLFDAPLPAGDLCAGPLAADRFAEIRGRAGAPAPVATWLVSVDLPVEAETPGEAVRQFWSYVRELGPRELPAYVSPLHDELAMQAYVLGEPTNLDPEEDEERGA